MNVQRGFRDKLSKYFDLGRPVEARFKIAGPHTYDFCCFGLDEHEKLADDRYMIFYNQQNAPENSISVRLEKNCAVFSVDIGKIPNTVKKLVMTASIDKNAAMKDIVSCELALSQASRETLVFSLSGADFQNERAIVAAEIYVKDEWRFSAVGRGYDGGLPELLKSFGGAEAAPPKKEASAARKVELKKGRKVNLQKNTGTALGEIFINLNWNTSAGEKKQGLFSSVFGGKSQSIDLDLGCLYELGDGGKGVVQALGNCFGDLRHSPYILLDGDDRTGALSGGETMRINGAQIACFKRVLVFAYIYQGVANWRQAGAAATVKCPANPDILVKLDEYDTNKGMCAIAMFENMNNKTFSVEKIVQFYRGHQEMDRAFHWGIRWKAGSK